MAWQNEHEIHLPTSWFTLCSLTADAGAVRKFPEYICMFWEVPYVVRKTCVYIQTDGAMCLGHVCLALVRIDEIELQGQ